MAQLSQWQKCELLRNSLLARELTGEQCEVLAPLITVRDLVNNEVLVDEGSPDDRLHVIVRGTLAVAKHDKRVGTWMNLYTMTAGDLAGELSFMEDKPHYAALRAVGSTRVFSLGRGALESLMEKEPVIVYRVMRSIFRFVHALMHRMSAQQNELTGYIYRAGNHYY